MNNTDRPRVFEVVSGCFDPRFDLLEDHVFCVAAPSEQELQLTLAFTGTTGFREVIGMVPADEIDYRLPGQAQELLAKLSELHGEGTETPRPALS